MLQFLKSVTASCLGVLLALLAFVFIGGGIIAKFTANSDKETVSDLKANSVLRLTFEEAIPELTDNTASNGNPFNFDKKILGLQDQIRMIHEAKYNSDIKGIWLDMSSTMMGRATASSVRAALLEFKTSGKFIVASGKYYTQGAYYLASVADKIYLHPSGNLDFRGFSSQIPFLKDMLDRLDVKMQIYYAGKFKSATEPLRLEKMSPENRMQTHEYLGAMYDIFIQDIAKSRNISEQELHAIAHEYRVRKAEDAVAFKLADALGYRDEVLTDLKKRVGLQEKDKLNTVTIQTFSKGRLDEKNYSLKNKIAVVYAEGDIVEGKGDGGNIGGEKYAEIIRNIRSDDGVKAIVLRVNSGGGSSMASENIWRELDLAHKAGKPVVVSMGDLAASGGYYIACAADSIVAEPNTLTGSIGVFGVIPSIQKTMRNKIGVNFDTVKTGKFAAMFTPFYDMTEEEGKIVQSNIDDTYERFLKRVSDARKMERNAVHEVAQGRVWTGAKAKSIGLVDKLGDLKDAIDIAAKLANLDKYRTSDYPKQKEKLQKLVQQLKGEQDEDDNSLKIRLLRTELGEWLPYYNYFQQIRTMSKEPQMKIPFIVTNW